MNFEYLFTKWRVYNAQTPILTFFLSTQLKSWRKNQFRYKNIGGFQFLSTYFRSCIVHILRALHKFSQHCDVVKSKHQIWFNVLMNPFFVGCSGEREDRRLSLLGFLRLRVHMVYLISISNFLSQSKLWTSVMDGPIPQKH